MDIKTAGSRPSTKGQADYFTGSVRLDPLVEAPEPARVRAAHVTFEPGANLLAYASPGADADRYLRQRPRSDMGRRNQGNPPG